MNACKEKGSRKKLKGEGLQFVKVTDEPSEPSGTAFVTAAQRKLMKKQKKQSKVNKEAVKQNWSKEYKLKFREQIAEFKPFKVGSLFGLLFVTPPRNWTSQRSWESIKAIARFPTLT